MLPVIGDSEGEEICSEVRFIVVTKSGAEVPILSGRRNLAYGAKLQLKDEEEKFERALGRRRRGPDLSYNCHGLTFVNRLGWLATLHVPELFEIPGVPHPEAEDPDEHIMKMLEGNSYQRTWRMPNIEVPHPIPRPPRVDIGDVILYVDAARASGRIAHSGIVVAVPNRVGDSLKSIMVLSKLGMHGEYFHPYTSLSRQYGREVQIWSDREIQDDAIRDG